MASSSAPESFPPHYIFVSQGNLPAAGGAGQSALTAPMLTFPIIHYHYADDPPLSLIPSKDRDNQPHIILDYDPASGQPAVVRSVSEGLAVTGIKVTDAPGVIKGVATDKNPSMFVIEAVSTSTTHRCVDFCDSFTLHIIPFAVPRIMYRQKRRMIGSWIHLEPFPVSSKGDLYLNCTKTLFLF